MTRMSGLRAHVQNGRLIVEEPTTLPEGTILDLVADDEGPQAQAGQGRPAEDRDSDLRRP